MSDLRLPYTDGMQERIPVLAVAAGTFKTKNDMARYNTHLNCPSYGEFDPST